MIILKFSNTLPQNQTLSEHCSFHAFVANQHLLNTQMSHQVLFTAILRSLNSPLSVNFVPALTKSTVLISYVLFSDRSKPHTKPTPQDPEQQSGRSVDWFGVEEQREEHQHRFNKLFSSWFCLARNRMKNIHSIACQCGGNLLATCMSLLCPAWAPNTGRTEVRRGSEPRTLSYRHTIMARMHTGNGVQPIHPQWYKQPVYIRPGTEVTAVSNVFSPRKAVLLEKPLHRRWLFAYAKAEFHGTTQHQN